MDNRTAQIKAIKDLGLTVDYQLYLKSDSANLSDDDSRLIEEYCNSRNIPWKKWLKENRK